MFPGFEWWCLRPFAGITGQTGISRFPVRGGRADPPTQEKGMWAVYHACAREWPAGPRPRALNLRKRPRPCAKAARASEFPTPVRKSILCNSHCKSYQLLASGLIIGRHARTV